MHQFSLFYVSKYYYITSVHSTINHLNSPLLHVHLIHCVLCVIHCLIHYVFVGSSDNTYSWHDSCETGQQNMDCQHCCHSNPTASHASAPVLGRRGRLYFFIVVQWVSHTKHEACVSQTCFLWATVIFQPPCPLICRDRYCNVVMLEPDALLFFCGRVLCKGLLLCNFVLPKKFIALASEFVMKRSWKSSLQCSYLQNWTLRGHLGDVSCYKT